MAKLVATKVEGIKQNPKTKEFYATWRMPVMEIDPETGTSVAKPMRECPQLMCKIVAPDGTPAQNLTEAKHHCASCKSKREDERSKKMTASERGEIMTLGELAEEMINHITKYNAAADKSVENVSVCFNRLDRFGLKKDMRLNQVTESAVRAARDGMLEPDSGCNSVNTVNQTIGKLQSAWNILTSESVKKASYPISLFPNPCQDIARIKQPKALRELRKHLVLDELQDIKKAVDNSKSPEFWRPMVALCIDMGLRVGEARQVHRSQITTRKGKSGMWLRIGYKTDNSARTLRIPDATLELLKSRFLPFTEDHYLFAHGDLGSKKDPTMPVPHWRTSRYMNGIFENAREGGIDLPSLTGRTGTWHSFRHTYAIFLLAPYVFGATHEARSLSEVCALLGHAGIQITHDCYGWTQSTDVSEQTAEITGGLHKSESSPEAEDQKTA